MSFFIQLPIFVYNHPKITPSPSHIIILRRITVDSFVDIFRLGTSTKLLFLEIASMILGIMELINDSVARHSLPVFGKSAFLSNCKYPIGAVR